MTAKGRTKLLVVLPCAPWPPRINGIALRYVPILRHLRQHYAVDVLVVADGRHEVPTEAARDLYEALHVIHVPAGAAAPLSRKLYMRMLELLPGQVSLVDSGYFAPEAQRAIHARIEQGGYDIVLWVGRTQLPALLALLERRNRPRVVVDLIDSPFLGEQRALALESAGGSLARLRLEKTRSLERRIRRLADRVIYIAEPDAAAVDAEARGKKISIIPNGIYMEDYEPARARELPSGAYLGFLGNLTYEPNVEAALRLHDRIFLPLAEKFADLRLLLIGRSPVPQLQALRSDRVIVAADVESIWPYVNTVDVFAFPLLRGSGLQNKVLEAMFCAKPVVLPTLCNLSVGARVPEEAIVADSDEEFRNACALLLRDPALRAAMGEAARAAVRATYDWSGIAPRFAALLESGDAGRPGDVRQIL